MMGYRGESPGKILPGPNPAANEPEPFHLPAALQTAYCVRLNP
jgi:hypothetical protein